MQNLFKMFIVISLSLLVFNAQAGTQVLGVEIGKSSFSQVKDTLLKKTTVHPAGMSKYTKGPMLEVTENIFNIEGLQSVLYIFDEKEILGALIMTLDQSRFDSIFNFLAKKYKLTNKKNLFGGDRYADFKDNNTDIYIDAPDIGFDMTVLYRRSDLTQQYHLQKIKESKEAAQF